ncbi:MAG: hypothetical protein OXT65_13010 [Alphaproteobacteria bacterium]|nr:hypothetical protein [Alphaproteobacteria bacterium]
MTPPEKDGRELLQTLGKVDCDTSYCITLINRGADLTVTDYIVQHTPLYFAMARGLIEVTQAIFNREGLSLEQLGAPEVEDTLTWAHSKTVTPVLEAEIKKRTTRIFQTAAEKGTPRRRKIIRRQPPHNSLS